MFFKKRELAGVKLPQKKVKTGDEDKYDVNGITLEGENQEAVPIYDSCDDVWGKIDAHLRDSPITNAAFMREIRETFPTVESIQSVQLQQFPQRKGATDGQESSTSYAAYV